MRPKRIPFLILMAIAGLAVWAGCKTTKASTPLLVSSDQVPKYKGDPNNPAIAFVTAVVLGNYHYLQHPLDREMSKIFFDNYINMLDPRHENFLQSDLAAFSIYRTNLDVLTLGQGSMADLTPAYVIYSRYAERAQQHCAYVDQLLKQDKFKFNTDETIQIDRRHEPFPENLDAAKALWKQRLRYEYLTEKLAGETFETNGVLTVNPPPDDRTNIVATLTRQYQWSLRMMTNFDGDRILSIYLEALAHAYDPHSDYFSAPSAQDFSIQMSLSLFGIGAQLQEDYGYCTIHELVPGGPAAKSGQVNPGDRIVAVAQGSQPPVNVVDMDLEKVVQLIRGKKGTEVRLTISPVDDRAARRIVTLVRDQIKLEDQETKAQLVVYPDGKRLGVIDVPSFYAPIGAEGQGKQSFVSVDTAKLIQKLKQEKVDGIILDLRSDPGGSLEEAVRFTGLFIKDGTVVLTRNANGQVSADGNPLDGQPDNGPLYDGPLAVMINRWSASASEIAAAALQDYGRALIIGDTSTFGKGTVQSLNSLRPLIWPVTPSATNDPGTIKITKGKFYRVTGASTQFKGVASDIVLPDLLDHLPDTGETGLDHPLPWDTIDPVAFDKLNLVQPYLEQLKKDSAARVAADQDFINLQKDITQYEKDRPDKSITLNEQDAIAHRRQLAADRQSRDVELNSRPVPAIKVYNLTLENSGQPGLPAPNSYFFTNAAPLNYQTNVPVMYYSFDTNASTYFALPDSTPAFTESAISKSATNVVYNWTHYTDLQFPPRLSTLGEISMGNNNTVTVTNLPPPPLLWNGLTLTDNTLTVTNPVVFKRIPPDATLNEAENIMLDYIGLLSKNSNSTSTKNP